MEGLTNYIHLPNNEATELNKKCLHAVLAEKPKRDTLPTDVVNIEQFGKILDWFGPLVVYMDGVPNEDTILDKIRKLLLKKLVSWRYNYF